MVQDGDILKWTLRSQVGSGADQILNVFAYEIHSEDSPIGLIQYGQAWIDEWMEDFNAYWNLVSSDSARLLGVNIDNLSNPLEFFYGDFTTQQTGGVTGDYLPQFNAWGFKLNRASKASRNGAKRFAGVPESLVVNGVANSAAKTVLDGFAEWLGQTNIFTFGDPSITVSMYPVIVYKPEFPGTIPPPVNAVASAVYRGVTTQNTRKPGRGS